jgi:hypothetical protein
MLVNKIASYLRSIIATLSIYNLKEYLTKSVSVMPENSTIKSIVVKEILNDKNLNEDKLKIIYNKLKDIIKSYNIYDREPFQITILKPIQALFNKQERFDPSTMFKYIRDKKDILIKSEKELKETKDVIKDVSKIPFPKILS